MEENLKDINFNNIKSLSKHEIEILNLIKERIENGKSAFINAWDNVVLNNINYITKKEYNGLNSLSLSMIRENNKYKSFSWLTFNQMNKLNEEIEEKNKILSVEERKQKIFLKKGSKGAKIHFPVIYDTKNKRYLTFEEFNKLSEYLKINKDTKETDIILSKKEFTVFNGDNFENLDLSFENKFLKDKEKEKIDINDKQLAIDLCKSMNVNLLFKKQNQAFYNINNDSITLPTEDQFYNTNLFKATFFHELSHSTGHEKRLNRTFPTSFGDMVYAFEEVVAESSAIFLSKKFNYFCDENINSSAEYLKSWSFLLKENPKMIIEAIKKGSLAKEYIEKCFDELEKTLEKDVIIKETISNEKEEIIDDNFEIEEDFEMEM